ncbi:DMT family transporter [Mangrovibacterium marinum]|uniref:Putative membrane protein n=1 Tax=Mangrovibacterium marinum TaxID=1639118 RepID=A0A2T5BYC6_9BACT|nr:DMT family transporter [Mangrovibacterium marinum]PTN07239.1 putative membrane protein [Mangrovibacterium marinum]
MKNQKTAILLALLAVLLWSTVATAFKLSLKEFTPFQLIFVASVVSLVFFISLVLLSGKSKEFCSVSAGQLGASAIQGFLNPFLYYLILFKAYALNPAQVTQALNMVWPVTLALLSVPLLGQKLSWKNFVAIGFSFAGVVFIASQGGWHGFVRTNLAGALLALASSLIWSFYWIFSARDKRDRMVVLAWNFIFGLVFLLGYAVFEPAAFHFRFTGQAFWAALYVGLFELGVTYVIWIYALHKSENNAVTGNFVFLFPFISLLFIHFILHETIYATTFVGLSFILLGILIQQIRLPLSRIGQLFRQRNSHS